MKNFLIVTLITLGLSAAVHAEEKPTMINSGSKIAFNFPDIESGQIAIQIGLGKFEVLSFMEEDGHATALSCETDMKTTCLAQPLRGLLKGSQAELVEKCSDLEGERRIARRHGVQKITSVCYFKQDKSFVEFN